MITPKDDSYNTSGLRLELAWLSYPLQDQSQFDEILYAVLECRLSLSLSLRILKHLEILWRALFTNKRYQTQREEDLTDLVKRKHERFFAQSEDCCPE